MELWIKALHIISVIAWMAGMLYLPRLFVYHADAPKGSAMSDLQDHGASASQSHHQPGNGRRVPDWFDDGVPHRLLAGALAAGEICPRSGHGGGARLFFAMRSRLRQ